jgi:uncharacterized SAM-binding protein YcdF (DUF218 family)
VDLFVLKKLISGWLMPPALPLLFILIGLLRAWSADVRRPRKGRGWVFTGTAILLLSSLGVVSDALVNLTQAGVMPLSPGALKQRMGQPDAPQAIVILGGGVRRDLSEDETDGFAPKQDAQDRLLYAARLARVSELPILLSGGAPIPQTPPEARVMRRVLERDLGVPVRWVEDRSLDTGENARFSAQILATAGVQRIVLVTSPSHLQRATPAFVAAGLGVTAAPTAMNPGGGAFWELWVPSAGALRASTAASHELLGRCWVWLRGLSTSLHVGALGPILEVPARV